MRFCIPTLTNEGVKDNNNNNNNNNNTSNNNSDQELYQYLTQLKYIPLEDDSYVYVLKEGSTCKYIFDLCTSHNIPAVLATIFCFEGNNVYEATMLTQLIVRMLKLDSSGNPDRYI